MKRWIAVVLAMLLGPFVPGCTPGFHDTTTPQGVPNLSQYIPGFWRMGQPPNDGAAWEELKILIAPNNENVTLVKLNDLAEGSDDYPQNVLRWNVLHVPIPPEDDKPWTVAELPDPRDVKRAVDALIMAHNRGDVVIHHCTHGRDRTSLIAALVGMRFGWTKEEAWKNMLANGFRWELPDLSIYWAVDVPNGS